MEIPQGTGYDGEIRHLLAICEGGGNDLDATLDEAVGLTRMLVAERESLIRRAAVPL